MSKNKNVIIPSSDNLIPIFPSESGFEKSAQAWDESDPTLHTQYTELDDGQMGYTRVQETVPGEDVFRSPALNEAVNAMTEAVKDYAEVKIKQARDYNREEIEEKWGSPLDYFYNYNGAPVTVENFTGVDLNNLREIGVQMPREVVQFAIGQTKHKMGGASVSLTRSKGDVSLQDDNGLEIVWIRAK
jgi:hypothetical protein